MCVRVTFWMWRASLLRVIVVEVRCEKSRARSFSIETVRFSVGSGWYAKKVRAIRQLTAGDPKARGEEQRDRMVRRNINMPPPSSARLSTLDCSPRVSTTDAGSRVVAFATSLLYVNGWATTDTESLVTRAHLSSRILNPLTTLPPVL